MKWTKQRLNRIFFLGGLAVVIVMLFTFDVSFVELWQHLCHAGYWLLPIVGIWIVIYGFNAIAWSSIIFSSPLEADEGGTPPLHGVRGALRLFRLTITGYALNYATPVGGLGGEPYRIMELSNDIGKERAASSVILYAMMHFVAHFFLWFSSVFLYLALAYIGDLPMNLGLGIVLGVITLFCVAAFILFAKGYRHGVAVKTLRTLSHIPGLRGWSKRILQRHEETLHTIDVQIATLHRQSPAAFWKSLVFEYISRIVQSLEIFFMLILFGIDGGGTVSGLLLTFAHSILILSFTTLFANMIGFLPMQIGVQEGGFVLSIAAMGLSAPVGIFVSIICRVREIIWILIGLLLMKIK